MGGRSMAEGLGFNRIGEKSEAVMFGASCSSRTPRKGCQVGSGVGD
jgi:hypothetical protein